MKGLLRGLRYVKHIFDEKEPELVIGLPTDVKHVAHIGSDGPSASKPSWMNDIPAAPELANVTSNSLVKSRSVQTLSSDSSQGDKQKRRVRRQSNALGSPKHARRQTTTGAELPARDQPSSARHPRQKKTKESSRLKGKNSSPDMFPSLGRGPEGSECGQAQRTKGYASHLTSVLELYNNGA